MSSVLVYFELSSQKAREKLVRIQFLSFDLSFCLVFFYQSSSKARAKLAQNSLSGRFPGFPKSNLVKLGGFMGLGVFMFLCLACSAASPTGANETSQLTWIVSLSANGSRKVIVNG